MIWSSHLFNWTKTSDSRYFFFRHHSRLKVAKEGLQRGLKMQAADCQSLLAASSWDKLDSTLSAGCISAVQDELSYWISSLCRGLIRFSSRRKGTYWISSSCRSAKKDQELSKYMIVVADNVQEKQFHSVSSPYLSHLTAYNRHLLKVLSSCLLTKSHPPSTVTWTSVEMA